jgi:hypothetical protein
MHRRCQSHVVKGCRTMASAFVPMTTTQGALARDLPETALYVTSGRPTTQPSAAPFTCSVAWVGEVAHGDVNHPHINGKDGVAGSIPAGGSTKPMTSADVGRQSSRVTLYRLGWGQSSIHRWARVSMT